MSATPADQTAIHNVAGSRCLHSRRSILVLALLPLFPLAVRCARAEDPAGRQPASRTAAARPAPTPRSSTPDASGWTRLFDGKTLAGWGTTGLPRAGTLRSWIVEDGSIACLGRGGGYLYTTGRYQDFILRSEFKVAPRVNSGIFFRWADLQDPVDSGIEVQILDSFGRVKPDIHDCGAVYDIKAPSFDAVRPAGEWNQIEITALGPILRIVLNNQQIIEIDLREWTTPGRNPDGTPNKFRYAYRTMTHTGHIGLQDHGGRVWYRNLQIKPLPAWRQPVRG